MVAAELKENRLRIERGADLRKVLTLHDWVQNKPTLAEQLKPRNEGLWNGLVDAYGRTFDASREGCQPPPRVEELGQLERELEAERSRLEQEL
jgi:hypothetical protein